MMKRLILTAMTIHGSALIFAKSNKGYTQYVNAFIVTAGAMHTFPGATLPSGILQLSPGYAGREYCSDYHHADSAIPGFSHLCLSGTGAPDPGDILLMPKCQYFIEAAVNDNFFWPEAVTAAQDTIRSDTNPVWNHNLNHRRPPDAEHTQLLYFDYKFKASGQRFGRIAIRQTKLVANGT